LGLLADTIAEFVAPANGPNRRGCEANKGYDIYSPIPPNQSVKKCELLLLKIGAQSVIFSF
jgi:hypothetical protein